MEVIMKKSVRVIIGLVLALAVFIPFNGKTTRMACASSDEITIDENVFAGVWEGETSVGLVGKECRIFFCETTVTDDDTAEYGIRILGAGAEKYFKAKCFNEGKYGIAVYDVPSGNYTVNAYVKRGESVELSAREVVLCVTNELETVSGLFSNGEEGGYVSEEQNSIALIKDRFYDRGVVQADIKGTGEYGLVFRYSEIDSVRSYYKFFVDNSSTARLVKVTGSTEIELNRQVLNGFDFSSTNTVKIYITKNSIYVYINDLDNHLFFFDDKDLLPAGKYGVTAGESGTAFAAIQAAEMDYESALVYAKENVGTYYDVVYGAVAVSGEQGNVDSGVKAFSAADFDSLASDVEAAKSSLDEATDIDSLIRINAEQNSALKLKAYKAMAKESLAKFATDWADLLGNVFDRSQVTVLSAVNLSTDPMSKTPRWWYPAAYVPGVILESAAAEIDGAATVENVREIYDNNFIDLLRAVCQHNLDCYYYYNKANTANYDDSDHKYWWFLVTYYGDGNGTFSYVGHMSSYDPNVHGATGGYRLSGVLFNPNDSAYAATLADVVTMYNWMITNQINVGNNV